MSFGKLLKQELKNQKVTQKSLALKIGISETAMSQIIVDKFFPSTANLQAICEELNVELVFSFKPFKLLEYDKRRKDKA